MPVRLELFCSPMAAESVAVEISICMARDGKS